MAFLDKTISAIEFVMDNLRPPAFELPPILLWCTAVKRDGMSSMRTTSRIAGDLNALGFDLTPNKDGTPNGLLQFIYATVNGVESEMKEHGVVKVPICSGQITFTGTGANAGGPVEVVGMNTNCINTSGLME